MEIAQEEAERRRLCVVGVDAQEPLVADTVFKTQVLILDTVSVQHEIGNGYQQQFVQAAGPTAPDLLLGGGNDSRWRFTS